MPSAYNADNLCQEQTLGALIYPYPHWTILPPPSEIDYAEHVAANCNMDIEVTNPSLPLADDTISFNFSLPPFNPHVSLEKVLNSAPISETNISTEPSPPLVICIVLMFQLTLAYGMATSWSHLFSVQTNFSIVTSTTSCIPFNAWCVSSSKEILKNAMQITSDNWTPLAN